MAVQDLTPQLRTRLSRLEKSVGWFVLLAALLLLGGLIHYGLALADRKGWRKLKAPYYTYLDSGAGIKVGDKIKLMGFDAGEITAIKPMPPDFGDNVYVEFEIFEPNFGYIWDDSEVRVRSSGLFGRYLEVSKGGTRETNNVHASYRQEGPRLTGVFSRDAGAFTNWQRGGPAFWLPANEPPELGAQLDQTVAMLKESLTNILHLTNALALTLNNAAEATGHANELLRDAKPLLRNFTTISENLKEPRGALGEWLLPVLMNQQITSLLTNANTAVSNVNGTVLNANAAVTNVNTNLVVVLAEVTKTLEHLSGITGNLRAQVERNDNIVSSLSKLIIDSDDLVQGLKKHWLLRSAFKEAPREKR